MSVLFLPPSAGAASIPDATETTAGKIRIATSAEATAGTNDLTSMTPLKVKSVVDAAVVGGVTYQGTFDASSPADLSNASKGDLYIISVAGSYQGQDWAVGDHLLINADMGGTLDPAKIDKVDNTDSVTSVAGRTGAVVLSAGDVSGLATVATSGAYSDLTGTPSLATVATTGAYSDLSGTPDVPVVENNYVTATGTATAISEDGHYAYWLNNTSPITLTIPAQGAGVVAYLTFANINSVDHSVSLGSGQFRLSGGASASSLSIPAGNTRSFYYHSSTYWELSSNELNEIGDVTITSPSNGEALIYNSTSGDWENGTVSASVAALDDIGDVNTTGAVATNVLKYDGANWVDGSVAYSEVTGTPTLATVATTGAYSDLTGTPTLATIATTGDYSDLNDSVVVQQFNATATASAISSNALHIFRLYGAGGFTLTLTTATVVNGLALFHNVSGSDVTIDGATFRANGEGVSGGATSITVKAGERRLYYLESVNLYMEANSTLIGHNADVTITSPSNGEALIYNSTSGDWENGTVSASVAALDDIGDVTITSVADGEFLKYDSASGDWVNGDSGLYSGTTYSTTTTVPTPSQPQTLSIRLSSSSSQTLTLPTGSAALLGTTINLVSIGTGEWTINPAAGQYVRGLSSALTLNQNQTAILTLTQDVTWYVVAYEEQGLGDLFDVTITTPANTQVIKYNSTSGDWENGAVAYADVSGTPALATVATTGAYSDLSGLPTLGTAAALDVGTSANNVVQLNGSAQLPAVDGSQLTGISASAPSVTVSSPATDQTLSAPTGIEEAYIYTPSTAITVNLVAPSTAGSGFRYQIKNRSANVLTIDAGSGVTIDGSQTFALSAPESAITLMTDGTNWFII